MNLDLKQAFQAPSRDASWITKIVVGGVVSMIPVVNLMAFGYALSYLQRLLKGAPAKLPGWEDYGVLFVRGLKCFVICLVYLLGVFVAGGAALVLLGFVGALIATLLGLAALFLLPVAIVRYVNEGESLAAALDVEAVYREARERLSDYLVVYLILVGASLLISAVASIHIVGPLIGFFASFYLTLSFAHLLAQVFGAPPGQVSGFGDSGPLDPV